MLKAWVTDTNETPCSSKSSTSLAKSVSEPGPWSGWTRSWSRFAARAAAWWRYEFYGVEDLPSASNPSSSVSTPSPIASITQGLTKPLAISPQPGPLSTISQEIAPSHMA